MIFYVLTKCVQSRLLQNCCMRERVNAYMFNPICIPTCQLLSTHLHQIINNFFFSHNVFDSFNRGFQSYTVCCKFIGWGKGFNISQKGNSISYWFLCDLWQFYIISTLFDYVMSNFSFCKNVLNFFLLLNSSKWIRIIIGKDKIWKCCDPIKT